MDRSNRTALTCAAGLALVLSFLPVHSGAAREVQQAHAVIHATVFAPLPVSFEVNRGQTDGRARFLARGAGYTLFLTEGAALLQLHTSSSPRPSRLLMAGTVTEQMRPLPSVTIGLRPHGGDPHPRITGLHRLPGRINDFIGNNPQRWHTDIPTYAAVEYRNVYPGIDLRYYGRQGHLEYDWVVAAGANPHRIALDITGTRRVQVDTHGDLIITAGHRTIGQLIPRVYQLIHGIHRIVAGRYVLTGHSTIHVALGAYDVHRPLTIDPSLVFSTDLGGGVGEEGRGIARDAAGNVYITGPTSSSKFPTAHALQSSYAGTGDAYIAKLSPSGTLLYGTYLGGKQYDEGNAIAVSRTGNAYITGDTYSTNFPTVHAFQPKEGGLCSGTGGSQGDPPTECRDAFVAGLSPNGDSLLFSTYLGGHDDEDGNGIAVDAAGNIYVTGMTTSTNFPQLHPVQRPRTGTLCKVPPLVAVACGDAFVVKLDRSGTHLRYSTYLGGKKMDDGYNIAVHGDSAYVTGFTESADFPRLKAIQSTYGGKRDAFVARLGGRGQLIYSSYLGGSFWDEGIDIAVDRKGNAYVVGQTASTDFRTVHPLQAKDEHLCNPDITSTIIRCTDAFVAKLDPAGTSLLYSTFLGGSREDDALGVAVGPDGSAYVVGQTNSSDFPTVHAVQNRYGGEEDGFLTRLDPAGSALIYSTYLGGSHRDDSQAVVVDAAGNAYVTGATMSTNFPVFKPATRLGGAYIAGIFRSP